jgi:hypothetical protein
MANCGGYINPGPMRAPYRDLPEEMWEAGKAYGQAWAALRQKYVPAAAVV